MWTPAERKRHWNSLGWDVSAPSFPQRRRRRKFIFSSRRRRVWRTDVRLRVDESLTALIWRFSGNRMIPGPGSWIMKKRKSERERGGLGFSPGTVLVSVFTLGFINTSISSCFPRLLSDWDSNIIRFKVRENWINESKEASEGQRKIVLTRRTEILQNHIYWLWIWMFNKRKLINLFSLTLNLWRLHFKSDSSAPSPSEGNKKTTIIVVVGCERRPWERLTCGCIYTFVDFSLCRTLFSPLWLRRQLWRRDLRLSVSEDAEREEITGFVSKMRKSDQVLTQSSEENDATKRENTDDWRQSYYV